MLVQNKFSPIKLVRNPMLRKISSFNLAHQVFVVDVQNLIVTLRFSSIFVMGQRRERKRRERNFNNLTKKKKKIHLTIICLYERMQSGALTLTKPYTCLRFVSFLKLLIIFLNGTRTDPPTQPNHKGQPANYHLRTLPYQQYSYCLVINVLFWLIRSPLKFTSIMRY